MKIAIGNDHTAVRLKTVIKVHLESKGISVIDVGTDFEESFDYPITGFIVANLVANRSSDLGILICGTGIGMSITANKVKGIRACVCSDVYSAKLSKQHNNTNILCFGSRVVTDKTAVKIADNWLDAEFEGGRHKVRVNMIKQIEETGRLEFR